MFPPNVRFLVRELPPKGFPFRHFYSSITYWFRVSANFFLQMAEWGETDNDSVVAEDSREFVKRLEEGGLGENLPGDPGAIQGQDINFEHLER
jgi:hypothetical protein